MAPRAPKHLSEIGRDKWKELSARLGEMDANDVDALTLLAGSWETYLTAKASVDAEGQTLESAINGRSFVNPAVNVMNEAHKQIVALSKAFGLAPTPRTVTAKASDDDADDMLRIVNGG